MKQIRIFNKFMVLMGKRIWIYIVSIIGMIVFDAGFSVITSNLINRLTQRIQMKDIIGIWDDIIFNVVIGIIVLIGWRYSTIRYNIEAKRATACVQRRVYSKALKLPLKYYNEHHTGEFISKLVFDTNKSTDIYRATLRRLISPIVTVIIYMVYMMFMCWQLTIILVSFNVVLLFYNTLFSKKIKMTSINISNGNKRITEQIINIINGVSVLKMYKGGQRKISDFMKDNKNFTKDQLDNNKVHSIVKGINGLSELVTSLIFLGVGVVFVSQSWVQIGQLIAIYTLYGSFAWNFKQIGKYIPEFIDKLTYAQNIINFLEIDTEKIYFKEIGGIDDAHISVKNVIFGYNNIIILDRFCLSVQKGEKVAIVAESGKGKSTLMKLLLGLYEPYEGNISIAGKNFCDNGVYEVRKQIAYVSQDTYLFNVSIKENIAYGKPSASDKEIIEAAKYACAHDFIMKLEKGYDTIVGEAGNILSGGECQRIAIARALVRKTPVMIFDEATSALDNNTEQKLYKKIFSYYNDVTMLIVTHRSSTMMLCERKIYI
jgi:ATP-binding cassette subfamily B protein